ncbi:hypothetical protein GQ42DRAFT_161170 [Ramicandelaber brevisporus]|nr:hypothetical protein GQ42DRAFT_161170 [Ramicandelaber brevisporus]
MNSSSAAQDQTSVPPPPPPLSYSRVAQAQLYTPESLFAHLASANSYKTTATMHCFFRDISPAIIPYFSQETDQVGFQAAVQRLKDFRANPVEKSSFDSSLRSHHIAVTIPGNIEFLPNINCVGAMFAHYQFCPSGVGLNKATGSNGFVITLETPEDLEHLRFILNRESVPFATVQGTCDWSAYYISNTGTCSPAARIAQLMMLSNGGIRYNQIKAVRERCLYNVATGTMYAQQRDAYVYLSFDSLQQKAHFETTFFGLRHSIIVDGTIVDDFTLATAHSGPVGRGPCFICKKPGHVAAKCPESPSSEANGRKVHTGPLSSNKRHQTQLPSAPVPTADDGGDAFFLRNGSLAPNQSVVYASQPSIPSTTSLQTDNAPATAPPMAVKPKSDRRKQAKVAQAYIADIFGATDPETKAENTKFMQVLKEVPPLAEKFEKIREIIDKMASHRPRTATEKGDMDVADDFVYDSDDEAHFFPANSALPSQQPYPSQQPHPSQLVPAGQAAPVAAAAPYSQHSPQGFSQLDFSSQLPPPPASQSVTGVNNQFNTNN